MADRGRENWRGRREEFALSRRAVTGFLTVLGAVLALAALAAYRGGTGFDVLRRYVRYGSAERSGGEALYEYAYSAKNRFAVLGDTLAVLSDTELRVLNSGGETVWSTAVNMGEPALSRNGNRAVAYDVGGRELYVVDSRGLVKELTAEEDEPYLSARLNQNGYLAVTAGQSGRKGAVRVYDANLEQLFGFTSSRRFLCDACVTDGNDRVAVVALGQENGVFQSSVVYYRLDSTVQEAELAIPDALALEIVQRGRYLTVAADTGVTWADTSGRTAASYSYGGWHLRGYDLGGDGFAALLLNRYQSGTAGRLVTVDASGVELGSLDVAEEVLSVSAAGRYVAVLYADRLVVYNQALQEYAALSGTDSPRQALARPDGSVVLLGSDSAGLFLP